MFSTVSLHRVGIHGQCDFSDCVAAFIAAAVATPAKITCSKASSAFNMRFVLDTSVSFCHGRISSLCIRCFC